MLLSFADPLRSSIAIGIIKSKCFTSQPCPHPAVFMRADPATFLSLMARDQNFTFSPPNSALWYEEEASSDERW
jgi:hypothetical protein